MHLAETVRKGITVKKNSKIKDDLTRYPRQDISHNTGLVISRLPRGQLLNSAALGTTFSDSNSSVQC